MRIIDNDLNPCIVDHEFDLIKDQPLDGVLHFNYTTKDWCEKVIAAAEANGIWTKERHESYPTHDMLLVDLDKDINQNYVNALDNHIKPMLIDEFTLEGEIADCDWVYECFIAKYSPTEQPRLSLHHDSAIFASVLVLNEDFEGGGTYFSRQKKLVKGKTGEMTVHPGQITHRHGGRPVTEGTRYILVTFINYIKSK